VNGDKFVHCTVAEIYALSGARTVVSAAARLKQAGDVPVLAFLHWLEIPVTLYLTFVYTVRKLAFICICLTESD
jgi:hypothetical protein